MSALIRTLATAALAGVALTAVAADKAPVRTPHPNLTLPEAGASGQRAIDLLGANLAAVAASYGKTPEALRQILTTDATAKLDANGRLFYVDAPRHAAPATDFSLQEAQQIGVPPAALSDTFKLHSHAGAKRIVYLDFNGATLVGTAWNSNGNTITALPYDFDGNPAVLSDAELQRIQYIWQRVAEDYAPFDVDVTTEEPTQDQISRTDLNDQVYGTTALITNNVGVYNCSCGGVAYVGAYDQTTDFYKPALIFWNMLANGDEKDVAEAISHEVGHNFGLNHDGTSTVGYYAGQGTGPTGWAPIMGVGYYQPLVQWSKGEYADANNKEDDLAIIQSNGGTLRPDDYGITAKTAGKLTQTTSGALTLLSGSGVIETRSDIDALSFTASAGPATFTASPDSRSGNLDILLRLVDSTGKIIATANPTGALGATINFTLPKAGKYYLAVDGTGEGSPKATGYSDYASLGQYTITGSANKP